MNRGMQTKHIKMKDRELQTEAVGALTSFGQISDGAEHYIGVDDTQQSTNLNLTQDMY